jgi:hypothetical protein
VVLSPVSSNEGRNLDIVVVGVSTEVMGGNSIEGNASPESGLLSLQQVL